MHFEVLDRDRKHGCSIEVIMADVIEIRRKPNQVFTFKNVSNFVDALTGHNSVIVHVGVDAEVQQEAEKANVEADKWMAYYWEKEADPNKGYGYSGGSNLLPPGSLAKLEMQNQYELEMELELRQTELRKFADVFSKVSQLSTRIREVDRHTRFGNADEYRFMSLEELERVLEEMDVEYHTLTKKPRAKI